MVELALFAEDDLDFSCYLLAMGSQNQFHLDREKYTSEGFFEKFYIVKGL